MTSNGGKNWTLSSKHPEENRSTHSPLTPQPCANS
jgi:hypothetical protein